ncbi:ADP-ribosylglycohydrolase family protein [Butyrivibrio sp. YAB3001]|uniref:ADP-ribosylglycohydrolase family protein n=1 Tax=Butyrivibrio sp. YAB3001 TaxID=1520812 RepID=UPI0008F61C93|nr:ADP-ribosylglycohydrolase family protein [Butyrivibrio sp. YAB3001]SFD02925.1 ADP-ribosylglycohydrolase [Butyrivibrio sp. YAB3001]
MWLKNPVRCPYESYGNGSAMRVSSVGWLCDSLEDTLKVAKITALPTHNHPEGIKGAQAIAAGIFLLRTGHTKDEVKKYISYTFGYDLDRKLDDIRPTYTFHVSCQKSVPEAIIAFFKGTSYEDVIRNAVSLGGDSDTIACIAGALAEVIYPIPVEIRESAAENIRSFHLLHESDLVYYNKVVLPKKNKDFGEQGFRI